jgi:glycosyltransferase involved in cell wall biosynthesis
MGEVLSDASSASNTMKFRLARREHLVWRRAEGYVTITATLADKIAARFGGRDHLAVVANGVRLPAERPAGSPVVAYAGHLYPWKGVDVILDALARLPEVEGLIVGGLQGEPDLDRVKQRARQLAIEQRVRFTGSVAPPMVASLLQQATILVLPSRATHISSRYTSPLNLFEYMAAARPIVASNLPSLREVLDEDRNALLVAPGSASELASAVRRLIADPVLAARLAAAACGDVTSVCWERRAEALEHLIESATSRMRPGARPDGVEAAR